MHQRFDVGDAKLALPPEPALQQAGQKGGPSPRANQRPPRWQSSQRGGEGRRRAAALNVPDQGLVINTNLVARAGCLEMLSLPLRLDRNGIMGSTQGVVPMAGPHSIDDSHIQGQSTNTSRTGANQARPEEGQWRRATKFQPVAGAHTEGQEPRPGVAAGLVHNTCAGGHATHCGGQRRPHQPYMTEDGAPSHP